MFPPSPIKPIWVRTTKADTLRPRHDGPSLTRLSTCSSFLATRVLDRRNRPNENRFRFPNRLPYKRSCSVSAAERCGRKNSADASCRKSQSQLDSVSFVHGSFPCVADRTWPSTSRPTNPNSPHILGPLPLGQPRARRNKYRKLLRPCVDGVPASDGIDRPSRSDEAEKQA